MIIMALSPIMDLSNFMNSYDERSKRSWDNRDTNLRKKNKQLDYSSKKFCDRFLKVKGR